jgi:hypothetical protein
MVDKGISLPAPFIIEILVRCHANRLTGLSGDYESLYATLTVHMSISISKKTYIMTPAGVIPGQYGN